MPVKWKIFLALNFTLSSPAFIGMLFLITKFPRTGRSTEDYTIFWIVISTLFVITINGFLNVFLLQRYYPDKLVPGKIKKLSLLSFTFAIVVTIGLVIMNIAGIIEVLNKQTPDFDTGSDKIVLLILALMLILQLAIVIMQGQLPRLLQRNHQNSMLSLIDSIGQITEQEN
jgi:hypothetical protein